MSGFVRRTYHYIRDFLFSIVNKEFLIFLFFLLLSGSFWLVMTLNESAEEEIEVPVYLTNVPKNAVMTTEMADTIRVTVRDKGFMLLSYLYGEGIRPVSVNFSTYANRSTGHGVVPMAEIQRQLSKSLASSSRIVSIKPDKMEFYFNYGLSKRVPVRLSGSVVPGKSFYLARTRFSPDIVTIYANKRILDSIKSVPTSYLRIANFEDTISQEVNLKPITGVKIVPSSVKITFYPDVLTEESMEVPILPIHVPEGKTLRTFPSRVRVKFIVGASLFRSIKAEQFSVVADYNELVEHPSDKCNVHLRAYPHGISKMELEINKVDYLIEQQ